MIIDKLLGQFFVHLQPTGNRRFFASTLLSFYGNLFIKGPKPSDMPQAIPLEVREHYCKHYFDIPVDRAMPKYHDGIELASMWSEQLRQKEHPQVAKSCLLWAAPACTILIGLGALIHTSSKGIEEWWQKRQAAAQVQKEAEYSEKRQELIASWTKTAQGWSAQRCIEEANDLRVRDTPQKKDQYSAYQSGCDGQEEKISEIGKSMSFSACEKYGRGYIDDVIGKDGDPTWADHLIWQDSCLFNHAAELQESLMPYQDKYKD
ncbi:hypothetical protein [Luteimonas sp. SDU101]|uniref:hypothetical protein n=1 Tax=Luteimonas sp. SDU101 TaxID=3422593 RepID=UPI003EBA8388